MTKIDPRRIVSVESPGMTRVRKIIDEATEPMDGRSIAKAAHVSFTTFANTYRHLLVRAGLIRVVGFVHNKQGRQAPTYLSGPQIGDPPVPPILDRKIATRAWKERTGYYEAEKAKRRMAKPPDFALAALMGLTPRYHHSKNNTTPAQPAERI